MKLYDRIQDATDDLLFVRQEFPSAKIQKVGMRFLQHDFDNDSRGTVTCSSFSTKKYAIILYVARDPDNYPVYLFDLGSALFEAGDTKQFSV